MATYLISLYCWELNCGMVQKSALEYVPSPRRNHPSALLVGMQTGEATVENSMEFPQKTKNGTALWPSNSAGGITP